jgi:hypothetical protein
MHFAPVTVADTQTIRAWMLQTRIAQASASLSIQKALWLQTKNSKTTMARFCI